MGLVRLLVAVVLLIDCGLTCVLAKPANPQISVHTDHDMSRPTYGLAGQSSSALTYDEKNGLNLKGNINDILGPPIKIVNGLSQMLTGSSMAGAGSGLKTGGAMLGIDAKLLEAAGGTHLVKGGLLLGGAMGKTALATALGGLPGKKISSIIEMPVKVIALKDLATGKVLAGMGKVKGVEALATKAKGASLIKEGDALKAQGYNQVMQGANEGLTNLNNMFQQTAGNAATAFKLLPIILDLPTGQQEQQGATKQQSEQRADQSGAAHPISGGSLFGGLTSLLAPNGGGSSDTFVQMFTGGQNRSPFNLFGGQNTNHNGGYAALLNNTNPLANLLMNPNLNPFLYPIGGGPLSQSIVNRQPSANRPVGFGFGFNSAQPSSSNFNLFPGIKMSESSSSNYQPQQVTSGQQQQQLEQAVENTKRY